MHEQPPRRRPAPPRKARAANTVDQLDPAHPDLVSLQRLAGNRAVTGSVQQPLTGAVLMRHPVAATPVHRHNRAELFDPPGTGFADFVRSIGVQADWFTEPSLTAADRTELHELIRRTTEGPHILAGVGDLLLSEVRGIAAADWTALIEYGKGRANSGQTVRLVDPAPRPLADRIALGNTLIDFKAVIPADVLGVTVSEAQLLDVRTGAMVPKIADYWNQYHPHLERAVEPGPGARGPEFQRVIDLLNGVGIAPFDKLKGRVRNLHRFPVTALTTLVANFDNHTRTRPVHLILFTGQDAAGAFQGSVNLFADLINDARNLHLMLEGQGSLGDITTAVPTIAADYGQPDKGGIPRIGQVMIAGHGEAQQVDLAGTGAPVVNGNAVSYPIDAMNLNDPAQRVKTDALLKALMDNMDPATARLVYAGCLVGSNPVPAANAAAPGAYIASHPSLADHSTTMGAAHGFGPDFVQGARAEVAIGASRSLLDPAGNMNIQYDFDPTAYGDATTYVATGHEPTGVFRSAVEVAATAGEVVAGNQLRARLALGMDPGHGWFDQVTIAGVRVALDGIPPAGGVPMATLNSLSHMLDAPFLVGNDENGHGRGVSTLVGDINGQPLAAKLYAQLGGMSLFTAPPDIVMFNARFVIEQAWINQGSRATGPLMAWLDATAGATTTFLRPRIDTGAMTAVSAALFPPAAAPTIGRIRLALAWFSQDPANADVRAFLTAQVQRPAAGPELSKDVKDQLDGADEHQLLTALGVVAEVRPPGGGAALPAANAQVRAGHPNEVRIEPRPYEATVLVGALNVRPQPNMLRAPVDLVHKGDGLAVEGFTHDWAAIDRNGKLGFVFRTMVSPP